MVLSPHWLEVSLCSPGNKANSVADDNLGGDSDKVPAASQHMPEWAPCRVFFLIMVAVLHSKVRSAEFTICQEGALRMFKL
ncbi:hypothetical protein B6S08_01265 [Oceanimonas doudoroffii]|uniref:Uncharacterized protein n=1 Tax=Oceanimonas doudoroffii TaxID=84158 RepID=A0A233RFM3_9GAMM|nr:hypothetical protein B6S08_01265 [Oceanimonas doudoroffii]